MYKKCKITFLLGPPTRFTAPMTRHHDLWRTKYNGIKILCPIANQTMNDNWNNIQNRRHANRQRFYHGKNAKVMGARTPIRTPVPGNWPGRPPCWSMSGVSVLKFHITWSQWNRLVCLRCEHHWNLLYHIATASGWKTHMKRTNGPWPGYGIHPVVDRSLIGTHLSRSSGRPKDPQLKKHISQWQKNTYRCR